MINITIEADRQNGKTTLALALKEFLTKNGFDVVVNDIDLLPRNRRLILKDQEERFKALAGKPGMLIRIETKQLKRAASSKA